MTVLINQKVPLIYLIAVVVLTIVVAFGAGNWNSQSVAFRSSLTGQYVLGSERLEISNGYEFVFTKIHDTTPYTFSGSYSRNGNVLTFKYDSSALTFQMVILSNGNLQEKGTENIYTKQ